MILDYQNLQLSRQHPQSTELFLSVFQPNTVLDAMVSGTVSAGSITIPFITSGGSYTDVEAGMTLLVGTSAGARDIGKLRVRSIDASNIVVAENSGITWTGAYLTILRYWEVWPVYPRIIPDPDNEEDVLFYKDYDIAYTDQNTILGTFVNAGPHRAGFAGDRFYYSASGTHNLVGSALTYDWSFEGGDIATSTDETPGYVTYDTPGHYVTKLVVTAANGAVDITYRYVSIYNRLPNTTSIPIQNWKIDNLSGSRGEGGFTTSISITNEVITEVYDGDCVVIWSEDWYGDTKQSLGGNSENNSNIFFVGHIQNGSIRYNYKTSEITFQVGSITDTMKSMEAFAISVESKYTPTKWFEVLSLDARRAIYHYLKWHSTVLSLADFQFMGTDRETQYFDSDRESLFDAVDNYMRSALLGDLVADRQGKLWAEVGAVTYANPTGSFPPIQLIDKRDWIGEPSVQQRLVPEKSFIEMGGVAYSGGVTGTYSAFLSQAPGTTPAYRGSTENIQGLTLESQSQLNELSGNVLANMNSKFPSIDLSLAGNFRQFDIAPLSTVDIDIAVEDTNLGQAIHAPYLIDSMNWAYSAQNKVMLPDMGLISLVNRTTTGETVTIPDVPEGGGYSDFGGGFNFNPGAFPPFIGSIVNATKPFWMGTNSIQPFLNSGIVSFGAVDNATGWSEKLSMGGIISINADGYPSVTSEGNYLATAHFYYNLSSTFTGVSGRLNAYVLSGGQGGLGNYDSCYIAPTSVSGDSITYGSVTRMYYLTVGQYYVPRIQYNKSTNAVYDATCFCLLTVVKL